MAPPAMKLTIVHYGLLATLALVLAAHALVEGLLLLAVAITGQVNAMRETALKEADGSTATASDPP